MREQLEDKMLHKSAANSGYIAAFTMKYFSTAIIILLAISHPNYKNSIGNMKITGKFMNMNHFEAGIYHRMWTPVYHF